MIPLGLTNAQQNELVRTLLSSHSINITVQVLNMAGERLSDISNRLMSGQVDIDGRAEITRSAKLAFLDVGKTLSFDSEAPDDTALYMDRMLRIIYGVKVPSLGWVDIPVFTGPITALDRSDNFVNVECQGKEALCMGQAWSPLTLKKGMRKAAAIETILRRRAGETKFSFPEFPARLGKDLALGRESVPWAMAKRVARSHNKHLFYDGRGVARLRNNPTNPSFIFDHGDGGSILTQPTLAYKMSDEFANIVWVKGGIPKGAKKAISYWFAAPTNHPLSPERLGRNGVPRYLLEVIEETAIRTLAEAEELAQDRLEDHLLQTVEVAFDSLPIPFLEPNDAARVETSEFASTFRIQQISLPLITGDPMTVGYMKRFPMRRRNGETVPIKLRRGRVIVPAEKTKKAVKKK